MIRVCRHTTQPAVDGGSSNAGYMTLLQEPVALPRQEAAAQARQLQQLHQEPRQALALPPQAPLAVVRTVRLF